MYSIFVFTWRYWSVHYIKVVGLDKHAQSKHLSMPTQLQSVVSCLRLCACPANSESIVYFFNTWFVMV